MKSSRNPPRRRRVPATTVREYHFDYSKSRSNRFASKFPRDAVVVILDSDVAKVFRDSKRVNKLLRAAITARKRRGSRKVG